MCSSKKAVITILVFIVPIFTELQSVALAKSGGLLDKAFFYRDISNFRGSFLKIPISKNKIIKQPFNVECSNLNRIILPFYIEGNGSEPLTFNLYENSKEQRLLFSAIINLADFPPPKKIGTYNVDGVLHYVWIPPVTDSKNKHYAWELRVDELDQKMKIGLYMTDLSNSQVQPVIIDGVSQDNIFTAFYSYCQYRFEWRNILKVTWERLKREKMFLSFYLVLMVGIIAGIKLAGKRNAGV